VQDSGDKTAETTCVTSLDRKHDLEKRHFKDDMSVHVPVGKENFFSKFFSQEHLPQTFTHFEINLQKCEGLPAKDLNGYSVRGEF
jgi:hypothetical protein